MTTAPAAYATINGKHYTVRQRGDGSISIYTQYDGFNIADRNFARSAPIRRTASVDPHGRLGKKILAAINKATGA